MSDSKGVEVPLYLTLLGGLSIVQAEKPVPGFVSNKARALLVYLAVTGRPHSRESLATLLWGDFPDAKARKNLRDVLSNLNQILPSSLVMTAQTVAFNQASPHWLDVAQFQAGCDGLRHNGGIVSRSDSLVALHDAVTLYNGDLLAGFSVREAEAWGEWVTLEQERLRQMALQALELLLSYEEEAGDYSAAIRTATRLLALAPWQETLYVRLMLLLARTGQYAAALAQYERCQRALMDELGVEPSTETTAVYSRIQAEAQAAEDDVFPAMELLGNPYKGLRAFGRADDGDFFGREAFAERLLVAVKTHSLVAVIGASGSGKSSVIQAGLLPRLEGVAHADCGGGQKTVVAVFRPGASPYAALAFPLASLGHPEVDGESLRGKARTLAERLHRGDMELREVICQIRWQHPDASEMVLVADQLEELYALCPSADTRRQFLNMLLGVVAEPEGSPRDSVPHLRVRLVLAMRADFMGQALAYRPFADALEAATLILGPLKRDELAQAIEQPACERGVAFESGLVARILEDVGDEPGNLPLLQFALTQLWSLSEQRRLTHATYDKIDGVQGALARHADEVYEKLDGAEHDLARRLFLQFVQPGNGTEDTRRVATRAELGEECWLLARRLADARLVVTGQNAAGEETAEIAHEALIREWGRLREWIDSDRQFRVWEEGLRAVRRQWEASARDDGALLRGAALHTAEQWLLERDRGLSSGDRDFIEASLNLHDRERARRHRSRRLLFGGLVAGLIAALFLSVTATSAWRGAETQRQAAVASRLAAQALSLLDSQRYDLALLLSIQSQRIADSLEARSSLLAVLSQLPYRAVLRGHTKGVAAIAFHPDGRLFASGSSDGSVRLWDAASGTALGEPVTRGDKAIGALAFSPDGAVLSVGDETGVITLWDVAQRRPRGQPLVNHAGRVTSLAFHPDGHLLASGGADKQLLLWDISTGRRVGEALRGHSGTVSSIAFSPDGTIMASGAVDEGWGRVDNTVLLWDVAGKPSVRQIDLNRQANVTGLAFHPRQNLLAVSGSDGTITLWDWKTTLRKGEPLVHTGENPATSVVPLNVKASFSPDGGLLASADVEGKVMIWDTSTRRDLATYRTGHTGEVTSLAFSPDGQTLASGSADTTTIFWTLQHPLARLRGQQRAGGWSLAFSPDGKILTSGGADGTVALWGVEEGGISRQLSGHSGGVTSLAFSPNSQLLISVSEDRTIIFWDVSSGQQVSEPLSQHTGGVSSAAFSPDGKTLATAGRDGRIILWDVARRQPRDKLSPAVLSSHSELVTSVAFSPDGKILASGSLDKTIRLWDVATGRLIGDPLVGHEDGVLRVAFDTDGGLLASSSRDGTLRLWNLATVQPVGEPLTGETRVAQSLAFSPDGRLLAAGGCGTVEAYYRCERGAIQIWDVASRRPLGGPLIAHTDVVWSVAFSPNSTTLASIGDDGAILFWDVQPQSWRTRACALVGRELTDAEWSHYLSEEPYHESCPRGH